MRTAEAHTGAWDEGPDGNKVAASAARRAYAASSAANDPKAMTPVAGRARTAQVAVRTAEANTRACDKGSVGEEAAASAALRAYTASGFTSNLKARSVLQEQQDNQGQTVL